MPHPILKKSTSKSSTSSKRRRVTFNEQAEAVHIRHLGDYSKIELQSYWYTIEDYHAIKEEANLTVDHYNRSQSDIVSHEHPAACPPKDLKQSDYCLRGLEHHTTSQKGLKDLLRRAAWDQVLDEQDAQYDKGKSINSAALSEVYGIYSLPALRIALQRGWADAKEAGYAMEDQPPIAVIDKASKTANDLPKTKMRRGSAQRKNLIVSKAA